MDIPKKKHAGYEYDLVRTPPPCYDRAAATFNIDFDRGTIFAYAPNIHVRSGKLEPDLLHHEIQHFRQQEEVGGPEKWWEIYFADAQQRLEWELEAYRAQYKFILNNYKKREHWPRLKNIGEQLVRMYNLGLTLQQAMDLVSKPEISTPTV